MRSALRSRWSMRLRLKDSRDKISIMDTLQKNPPLTLAILLLAVILFSGYFLPPAAKLSLAVAEKLGPRVLASEFFLKTAAVLNPNDAKHNFYIGLWYHQAHKLREAKKFYKKALELDPEIANTHYQLARVYFIGGQLFSALQEINKELEVNPLNPRSYYIKGLILGYMGRFEEAEESFKTFLKSDEARYPNGWGGYVDLGWVLMRQKKYQEALWILKEAEDLFSPNTWVYNGLGAAHLALKNYDTAEDYYKKAYEGAKKMTVEEWLVAYPAHDPKTAEDGIKQIIESIEKNISLVREKNTQKQ